MYTLSSNTDFTFNPLLVVVEPMRLTFVSKLVYGFPLQFIVINEKSQCSILFHLLALGGK
jgi:hypothetical protein